MTYYIHAVPGLVQYLVRVLQTMLRISAIVMILSCCLSGKIDRGTKTKSYQISESEWFESRPEHQLFLSFLWFSSGNDHFLPHPFQFINH
jgi:hypothetical protein